MALKASKSEIKEILFEIQQKLEITEKDIDILTSVIDNDIYAISIILFDEGAVRKVQTEMEEVKLRFLKQHSKKDYEVFKKYYKAPANDWTFLTDSQRSVLRKLNKLYKGILQKYFEDRGDLMIYRKTINSFLASRLKNKESLTDLREVRNYLLNNYSYYDTLHGLGLNPEIGDDGFVKLNKLKLNEQGYLYSDI